MIEPDFRARYRLAIGINDQAANGHRAGEPQGITRRNHFATVRVPKQTGVRKVVNPRGELKLGDFTALKINLAHSNPVGSQGLAFELPTLPAAKIDRDIRHWFAAVRSHNDQVQWVGICSLGDACDRWCISRLHNDL